MRFVPPDFVRTALDLLTASGHEAWLVGGCVRDACLKKTPGDYDIATSALPAQTRTALNGYKTFDTGLAHGTLSVLIGGRTIEITTYRRDGAYTDSRRPDSVTFVRSLDEDLARRDFTCNAMAYNPEKGLYDPFDGRADCERRLLRAVGEPLERFHEDALRILRALRFACQLGFRIEDGTLEAMMAAGNLLKKVSRERVAHELNRALLGEFPARALRAYPDALLLALPELESTVHQETGRPWERTLRALSTLPSDLPLRWAALFALHGGSDGQGGADALSSVMARLKQPGALCAEAVLLLRWFPKPLRQDNLKPALSELGYAAAFRLLALKRAFLAGNDEARDEIRALDALGQEAGRLRDSGACLNLRDLAVSGTDLLAIGYRENKALGQALDALLQLVLRDKLPNEREALLKAAAERLAGKPGET